jgi:cbb3-type cytochrome oxidase subunit 3
MKKAIGVAVFIGVLFATVWVVSKAWKKGQN